MSYQLAPLERQLTELGCLVETRRQTNAHGLEIESVVLSVPDHQPTDQEETNVRSTEN